MSNQSRAANTAPRLRKGHFHVCCFPLACVVILLLMISCGEGRPYPFVLPGNMPGACLVLINRTMVLAGSWSTLLSRSVFLIDVDTGTYVKTPWNITLPPGGIADSYCSVAGDEVYLVAGVNPTNNTLIGTTTIINIVNGSVTTIPTTAPRSMGLRGSSGHRDLDRVVVGGGCNVCTCGTYPFEIYWASNKSRVEIPLVYTSQGDHMGITTGKVDGHWITAWIGGKTCSSATDGIVWYNYSDPNPNVLQSQSYTVDSGPYPLNAYSLPSAIVDHYLVFAGTKTCTTDFRCGDPHLHVFDFRTRTIVYANSSLAPHYRGAAGVSGPFVYFASGMANDDSGLHARVEAFDTRDFTMTFVESVQIPSSVLEVISVPGLGTIFMNDISTSPFDIFSCGNGVIDYPYEVCDSINCTAACTKCTGPCVRTPNVIQSDCVNGLCVAAQCAYPCLCHYIYTCVKWKVFVGAPGFMDCDGDYGTGCEQDIDFQTSICGDCANNCDSVRALAGPEFQAISSVYCNFAKCGIAVCGFLSNTRRDCNQVFSDGTPSGFRVHLIGKGCEVDTSTSIDHCGICDRSCAATVGNNALATCVNSLCQLGSCNLGFGNCDGFEANGCETPLANTTAHCGTCGLDCLAKANVLASTCTQSLCNVNLCNPNWGDCDANGTNGCETSLALSDSHCGLCGKVCVDQKPPDVRAVECQNGTCIVALVNGCLKPGFQDCNIILSDGCETDTHVSSRHCGKCGNDCEAQGLVCSGSICTTDVRIIGMASGASVLIVIIVAVILFFVIRRRLRKQAIEGILSKLPKELHPYVHAKMFTDGNWESLGPALRKKLEPGSEEYALMKGLLSTSLRGSELFSLEAVDTCWAVINLDLLSNFATQRAILSRRLEEDATLFNRDDWIREDRKDLRQGVRDKFGQIVREHGWNKREKAPVVPMIHGTGGEIAWKIIQNGFSALSTLDAGFYGSGMYYTSSSLYAVPYYAAKANPALLICLVSPGNPYPVVESKADAKNLMGMPIRAGYQSHYVLTEIQGDPVRKSGVKEVFDELVIGQESQVIPVYVVELKKPALGGLLTKYQRDVIVTNKKREDEVVIERVSSSEVALRPLGREKDDSTKS